MLVIGTHGRTGIGRFAIGSVVARRLCVGPCPVITVTGRQSAGPGLSSRWGGRASGGRRLTHGGPLSVS